MPSMIVSMATFALNLVVWIQRSFIDGNLFEYSTLPKELTMGLVQKTSTSMVRLSLAKY